jgi:hypothetical protein
MRRWRATTLGLATMIVTACGSDTSTAPDAVVGIWTMQSVNGSPLPYTVQLGGQTYQILADQLTLRSSRTFTDEFTIQQPTETGGVDFQTIPSSGTFAVNGNTVVFTYTDGSTETGTVSGESMTIAESGFSAVYTKQ